MAAAKKLYQLQLKYDIAVHKLKTTHDQAVAFQAGDIDLNILRPRYADLPKVFEELSDLFVEICGTLNGEAGFDEGSEREKFESYQSKYYDIQIIYSEKTINDENPGSSRSDTGKCESKKKISLPRIEIEKFSGEMEKYISFRDLFKSLIESDGNLSATEKMYYLVASLSGEAKVLVQHLTISGDSYPIAWELLKARYENKRVLADKLLGRMLGFPPVQRSSSSLRTYLNTLLETTEMLKTLEFPVDHWSYLLTYLSLQKVDTALRTRYETQIQGKLPTFVNFVDFLRAECRILETVFPQADRGTVLINKNSTQNKAVLREPAGQYKTKESGVQPTTKPTLTERNEISAYSGEGLGESNISSASSVHNCSSVLLGTALVQVKDKYGNLHHARCLLDSGSQVSFVTHELAQRLGLARSKTNLNVMGIGGGLINKCQGIVNINIFSFDEKYSEVAVCGLVLPKLTGNLPSFTLPGSIKSLYADIRLADGDFYYSRRIDILLGADVLGEVFSSGSVINVHRNMPYAVPTIFGYVLMGPVSCTGASNIESVRGGASPINTGVVHSFKASLTLESVLERFWNTEEVPNVKLDTPEDVECETQFKNTHGRNEEGRFIVRLPLKDTRHILGESRAVALRRFYNMESKLNKNAWLREKYVDFMREYADLRHMTIFTDKCQLTIDNHYFIPHHGIFKSGESQGKIRVVFDGSCKTTSGFSLNDCLQAGPKLQSDIIDIICQFRLLKYVFVTDIRMMFRQILIHPDDRYYQLIFWRESPDLPLQTYTLNTNTYGLKSSPYVALRTLLQLADDGEAQYPQASRVLRSSVYMDDIFSGDQSIDKACELKQDITNLLQSGGFELRKWASNSPELISDIPSEFQQLPHEFETLGEQSYVKILGIQWNPVTDHFTYKICVPEEQICTKRTVLSTIARTFDPLGWISPVIFKAKLIMQSLWLAQIGWDEPLPGPLCTEWELFLKDLPNLNQVRLNRWVTCLNVLSYSLHGFSDGSEKGFGAVVYLRIERQDGQVSIHLIAAKSRVAPIRSKLTIPKTELSGAVLLTRLMTYVIKSFRGAISLNEVIGWVDSTIVLCWLRTPIHLLQTFEGNRVSPINTCGVNIKWRHVPTNLNPADVVSRGCSASQIVVHSLWWVPEWLLQSPELWPENIVNADSNQIPGLRNLIAKSNAVEIKTDTTLLLRCSSLTKLEAVTALCFRFIFNCRNPKNKIIGPITAPERKFALNHWIKMVQREDFKSEIDLINTHKPCTRLIRRLMPFLGRDGVLRVGGRLKNSKLSFAAKYPILLPKGNPLTVLIIDFYHIIYCHIGPTALQAILQQQFWIMSARQVIKSRIFKCIRCFRLHARPAEPKMADLPADRVTQGGTFKSVATDYAGPFNIKASKFRNAKIVKAYLCLFVCLVTKAVHLEVVSDMTTEGFLSAFTRFVSRRGLPKLVRSDCGANYIGTNRHLNDIERFMKTKSVQNAISDHTSVRGVVWHFNAPGGPHLGGLFEAAVKSAKSLLNRVIGDQVLTFEELTTVFTRIEAVLNSRPLCPLSSDPAEFEVLTPAHLLVGRPLLAVPEYQYEDTPSNRLSRFELLQSINQQFWKIWQRQYLHTLQMRNKWFNETNPPRIGDLVLIKEDGLPSLQWKRGRILVLIPGKDGIVRVVKIKTMRGELTRPVIKICRLPIYD